MISKMYGILLDLLYRRLMLFLLQVMFNLLVLILIFFLQRWERLLFSKVAVLGNKLVSIHT